jgi:hypothetical protein
VEFGGFEASDAELQDALFGPVTPGADSSGATQLPAITVTPSDSAADSSIDYMQPIPGSEQSDLGAFLAAPGQVIRTHNYGQSAPDDAPLLIGGSGVDYGPRIGVVDYFNVIRGGIASFIPEGVRDFEYSRIVSESARLSSVDNVEYDGIDDYTNGDGAGWRLSIPSLDDLKNGAVRVYNAFAATFGEGQNTRNVSNLEYHDIDSYPEDIGSGSRLSIPTGGELVDFANAMYGRSLSASNAFRDAIEQGYSYRAGLAFGSDPMVQGMGLMVGAFGLTKPVSASGRFGPNKLDISPGQVNYMSEGDQFFLNASKRSDIDPNGSLDVIGHGSANTFQIESLKGVTGVKGVVNSATGEVDHRLLANIIKNNPEYTGQNIRLLSCSTGSCDVSLAQNLANKLNVTVEAPSDVLWATSKGDLFVSPMKQVGGVTIPTKPIWPPQGEWRIFTPGANK